LDADEQVRHKGELVYPNVFLSVACDHVAAFILQPRGPERTDIVCHFLFETHEMAKPGFDPSDAVDFWDLVNRQDWAVCESAEWHTLARPQPWLLRAHETGTWTSGKAAIGATSSASSLPSGFAASVDTTGGTVHAAALRYNPKKELDGK
jgi:hypothetical protein